MGRRCRDWDYGARAIYMITINLKERGRPVMAEWPRLCASPEIKYNGMVPKDIDSKVREALRPQLNGGEA